jgi:hypothetical protein
MRVSAIQLHARWLDAVAAFAVLALLVGMGAAVLLFDRDEPGRTQPAVRGVANHPVPAHEFTEVQQRIVGLLPAGYTAAACMPASNAFPNAIGSLDCTQNQNVAPGSPAYARFTLYDSMDALNGDFQASVDGMAVSPCPDGNVSPGTWTYDSDPGQIGGKVACGRIEDVADIAWTRDDQLLLSTVDGGADLNGLYLWWQRYGGRNQHRNVLLP